MAMWHFKNIPPEIKEQVKALYDTGNLTEIIRIYNAHKVAPDLLTPCCGVLDKVKTWTNWAIQNNKI